MRQEVRDMAQRIADKQLEDLEYMSVIELQEEYDVELSDDEAKQVFEAVVTARTTLDPVVKGQIKRLQHLVMKFGSSLGFDIADLIDNGLLEEEDMD